MAEGGPLQQLEGREDSPAPPMDPAVTRVALGVLLELAGGVGLVAAAFMIHLVIGVVLVSLAAIVVGVAVSR